MGLTTLLFAASAFQSQFVGIPDLTPEEVWPYLRKIGFDARSDGHPESGTGIVMLAGQRARIGLSRRPKDRSNKEWIAVAIYMNVAYWPVKRVSAQYIQDWAEMNTGGSGMQIRSSLDGTIRVSRSFILESGVEATLQAGIRSVEESLRTLLEELPPSEKPNIPPLDPNIRIDFMNGDDAAYLLDQWKWRYRGGFGASTPTWICPADVDGTLVVLQGAHPGQIVRDRVLLRASSPVIEKSDISRRVAELSRKLKGISVDEAAGPRLSFIAEVDLAGGMTLRDFKERIKRFALAVAPYVKPLKGV